MVKLTLASSSLKPLSIAYVNDMYRGIRTALEMKEVNLRYEYTCKV